jgi:cadmium resistance protein CadD (predicted permease)
MTSNIGTWDRNLRIAIGLALLSLVFVGPQTLWGLLGLIPLISGLARFCPAYRMAGVDTCGPHQS